MRIYLDNSVLNRPFDDQSVAKIRLEATATFFIFELIDSKKTKLTNSSVIEYENSKSPFPERRFWISAYLSKSSFHQKINAPIKMMAKEIEKLRISPIDSLHLASSEAAKVDYFITCDNDILKKHKGHLKVVDPIAFIQLFKSK